MSLFLFSFLLHFINVFVLCVHMNDVEEHAHAKVCMRQSEGNLQESVNLRSQTEVNRLGSRYLFLLNHLTVPDLCFFNKVKITWTIYKNQKDYGSLFNRQLAL